MSVKERVMASIKNGFVPMPQEVLGKGYRHRVHVENWNKGCQFVYVRTVKGCHELITPVTRKRY